MNKNTIDFIIMPKVSVLIPVYNTLEEHLQLCIESILNQSFKDFELIIVNDGSTEPQVERIVKSFDDARIRYYLNDENMGISKTRNYLIDLAQSEYLAIMDHDDFSAPDRLEKQVAFLDTHPEYGVVSARQKTMHSGSISKHPTDDENIRMLMMEGCPMIHSCTMLRKSVLDDHKIRYEEEFTPAEDYALYCRLMSYTKLHNLESILLHYRYHADNTSHRQANRMKRSDVRIKSMMKLEHPLLFEQYSRLVAKVTRVRLFGCIPLLKIISCNFRVKVKLFNIFTILSMRTIQRD